MINRLRRWLHITERIRQWLSPSLVEEDQAKAFHIKLLNGFLVISILFILMVIVVNLLDRNTPLRNYVIDVLGLAICLYLRRALQQGRVEFVGLAETILSLIFLTAVIANEGTIYAPATIALPFVIILAGTLFGLNGIVGSTIACSLVIGGMIVAQNTPGLLPVPSQAVSFVQWFVLSLTFGVLGTAVFFVQNQTQLALAQSQKEITERKRMEETLQISEARHRLLAENARDVIWVMGLDGSITYVSPAVEQMRGLTPAEAMQQPIEEILTPASLAIIQAYFQKLWAAAQAGQPLDSFRGEIEYRHKDGSTLWTEVIAFPVPNSSGGFMEILGVTRDIRERKRSEEALRKLSRAVEQSPSTIVITNLAGDIEYANPKFTQTTGYTLAEALGKNPRILKSEHTSSHEYKHLWETITAGGEWRGELQNKKKNGETYWEAATIAPIWDEYGTITHFLAVKEDITERKRAEAALRDLNATLEQRVADRTAELQAANLRLTELDHLKDEFLARISHELRTPLTGILISLELLEAAKPEKRERYLQRLKQSAGRLRDMIEDVLMFSQLNLYTRPETLSPIDLNDLIACHLTTWQKLSAGHDLQLQLDLTHDLPHVRTDGELIGQAINRLVINAINYTPAGSVIVSTATRDEDDRRGITISVADTGPGITPDDLPHIFERFYRGRAAADYQTPGTGIGLSISREIAEKLGGRLTVDTQVGVGSTFTLWLPVTA